MLNAPTLAVATENARLTICASATETGKPMTVLSAFAPSGLPMSILPRYLFYVFVREIEVN